MSLRDVLLSYKWQFLFTLVLVLIEAALLVLFPLFIGYAIEDAIGQKFKGMLLLGILGVGSLIIGAGRRCFDSRFYAKVYENLGADVVGHPQMSTSSKTARLGMQREIIEFFENAIPEIINNTIGLIGTLLIVALLDRTIFVGCLLILLIILMVYGSSKKRTVRLNALFNDELEKQVVVIEDNYPIMVRRHLKRLMKWNIRLSDLETINFSIIWLFMIIFLVGSIGSVAYGGVLQYGAIFSLILYLFQFIESMMVMPLFYQQWLRLTEITDRLRSF